MLIYIGTPMAAVGLWKREDIDRVEASLYRKIMRIGNDIPNAVVLNTMTNIRLAGEVIHHLSKTCYTVMSHGSINVQLNLTKIPSH
jgi:hypothetical protein